MAGINTWASPSGAGDGNACDVSPTELTAQRLRVVWGDQLVGAEKQHIKCGVQPKQAVVVLLYCIPTSISGPSSSSGSSSSEPESAWVKRVPVAEPAPNPSRAYDHREGPAAPSPSTPAPRSGAGAPGRGRTTPSRNPRQQPLLSSSLVAQPGSPDVPTGGGAAAVAARHLRFGLKQHCKLSAGLLTSWTRKRDARTKHHSAPNFNGRGAGDLPPSWRARGATEVAKAPAKRQAAVRLQRAPWGTQQARHAARRGSLAPQARTSAVGRSNPRGDGQRNGAGGATIANNNKRVTPLRPEKLLARRRWALPPLKDKVNDGGTTVYDALFFRVLSICGGPWAGPWLARPAARASFFWPGTPQACGCPERAGKSGNRAERAPRPRPIADGPRRRRCRPQSLLIV